MNRAAKTCSVFSLLVGLVLAMAGCGKPQPINSKTFSPEDQLSSADVKLFLDIVKQLPPSALRNVPAPYQPPPKWDAERTLPVNELAGNELHQLNARWKYEPFLTALPESKEFDRILKRRHISAERFASLAFAIGAALSKSSISPEFNTEAHHKKAAVILNDIKQDARPFHTLSPDMAHEVQRKAAWIGEFQRCERLSAIPQLNARAVQGSRKTLAETFHPSFSQSPFNSQLDRNLDVAMPFEDLPGNEGLELIEWSPNNAIIGRDDLDSASSRMSLRN